jgi:hypothetical protein
MKTQRGVESWLLPSTLLRAMIAASVGGLAPARIDWVKRCRHLVGGFPADACGFCSHQQVMHTDRAEVCSLSLWRLPQGVLIKLEFWFQGSWERSDPNTLPHMWLCIYEPFWLCALLQGLNRLQPRAPCTLPQQPLPAMQPHAWLISIHPRPINKASQGPAAVLVHTVSRCTRGTGFHGPVSGPAFVRVVTKNRASRCEPRACAAAPCDAAGQSLMGTQRQKAQHCESSASDRPMTSLENSTTSASAPYAQTSFVGESGAHWPATKSPRSPAPIKQTCS